MQPIAYAPGFYSLTNGNWRPIAADFVYSRTRSKPAATKAGHAIRQAPIGPVFTRLLGSDERCLAV